jgi:4-alpha-glucanotransferase
MSDDTALRALASGVGISTDWYDYAGRHRIVSPEVLRRILAALGLPCETPEQLMASAHSQERPASLSTLPPLVTGLVGAAIELNVGAAADAPARLVFEHGAAIDVLLTAVDGRLRVPAISQPGYHRLSVSDREITLAVAPAHGHRLDDIEPEGRLWGLAVQVYGLRRPSDGGIGDAAAIASLAESAARQGADVLGLSPLHALFSARPEMFGPYAPSSRLFLNPLYASPTLVLGEAAVSKAIARTGLADRFAQLEALGLIDWPAAAQAKFALLAALFDDWQSTADTALHADLAAFTATGGALLAEHATFEALHAEQVAAGRPDWRRWPDALRDPASGEVAAFKAAHQHNVAFHIFTQWLTDRSLGVAQARACQAGMRVGLVSDLAVGMDPSGSHAWSRQRDVLNGLAVGAPPDMFNQQGQEWGLTSFSPRALVAGGFAPFLATVRAALRHAGGIRIDHAMGLMRLWLVPQGASPEEGAYLAYPVTDMLRLMALESYRHQAIVIGEDLGTVPEGFRELWVGSGAQGMRVMWFERDNQGFIAPDRWPRHAAAMTSTHDLPTVAGWWRGGDITTRVECGRLGKDETEIGLQTAREADRAALWRAFVQADVAAGEPPSLEDAQPIVDAAVGFVASAASALCLLPLEDLLGLPEQPNLPGTIDEHPNWRRRLPQPAEALLAAPRAAERVATLRQRRGRQS